MPSKKRKYNARFPAGRIKKIMQTDEEIGKVAQAVPIIISRTLELFVHSLLTKAMQITSAKNAKTLSPTHMKQCIMSESRFDFLKDLVKSLPDVPAPDDEVPTPPATPASTSASVSTTNTAMNNAPHSELEHQKQLDVPNHKCTRENPQEVIVKLTPQVPQFEMSIPVSFQMSQPNFYMELNPTNLSESTSSRATSNSNYTAGIDEDYDT
ncbi:PREDICTED: dr1-associated corepressor isoform X2 [Dinoponera quadriceps]|uniref:Dr1-associated corepressor isoform X2 n=1 Tax=Dinoponera quadriceps TaxID=609295 RepID=A0A6P3WRA8_DINQU|nr:PREDICTED: dr1-associated corepressor isoform X2 [Dinoponera quadriceps]